MSDAIKDMEAKFANVRSMQRWIGGKITTHDGLDSFESLTDIDSGVHTIVENGLPIDIYVKGLNLGNPLVVFFNGAQARTPALKLPVFAGFGVLPPDTAVLCINDPSLYLSEKVKLGWYAGSLELNLQDIIPRIVRKIAGANQDSRLVFTGGSGGGFASLFFSSLFPDSLALVWNPQTDLLNYKKHHVTSYVKAAWNMESIDVARQNLQTYTNGDIYTKYKSANNFVVYMQNVLDWHVESHLKPLLSAISSESETKSGLVTPRFYLHMANWGEDHAGPPRIFLKSVYEAILLQSSDWPLMFKKNHVSEILSSATVLERAAQAT